MTLLRIPRPLRVVFVVVIVALCQLVPAAHAQGILGLQQANWALLAVNGGVACLQSGVVGNVGAVGNVVWAASCTDIGSVILSGNLTGSGTVTGGVTVNASTVKAAASNAYSVSATAAGLSCTLGKLCGNLITTSLTINGSSGQNVLKVAGIVLGSGNQITINSPAGSTFIINVTRLWVWNRAKIILAGGITPNDVLINYVSPFPVLLGGGLVQGVILAPKAAVAFGGGVNVTPELIAKTIVLGSSAETGFVGDDFTRANGPVGPNWQDLAEDAMFVSGNELVVDPADPADNPFAGGYWKANSFTPNQFSQARIAADSGSDVHELLLRASGDSITNRQWYQVYWDGSGKLQAGFFANNPSFPGSLYRDIGPAVFLQKNAGDILRFEVVGPTLNVYVNGALQISTSDAVLTSGSPGILVHGSAKFDNWSGGNLP